MNRDSAVPPPTVLSRCSDSRGFALIEAVVAAAVFAVIVLGVLAGIDGAAGSSGREKARSVAGTLAEQDQERMRGMRAVDLSNYSWTRDVTHGGSTYTIASETDWIRDNTGGTISCTNSSSQADYLRIRTTVTSSSVGKRTAPVKIDSLVAPPVGAVGSNQGTLTVQINNRDAVGVPNVPVKITSGAFSMTELTNSVGCAVFAYVPVGSYDVNVNEPGKVNPMGTNDVHVSGSVSNGTTNVTTIVYDVAGSVTASFRTRYWDAATSAFVDAPSRVFSFSLANAGVTSTGYRQFTPAVAPADTVTATQLFPFKDQYGLYSGRCLEENPTVTNGGAVQIVDRGGIYNETVYQPALRVRVMTGSSPATPVAGAFVKATLIESGACAGDTIPSIRTNPLNGLTTYAGTGASDPKRGYVTRPAVTGFPFDPGIPYGQWSVCADNGTRQRTVTVDNYTLTGTPSLTTINLSTTGSSTGTCP